MLKHALRVAAQPQFIVEHSPPELGIYSFAYRIVLTNVGEVAAQLIARHWVIVDAHGGMQEAKDLGVVGQRPLLRPGEGFEYTSGCRLPTAGGSTHGSFFLRDQGWRALRASSGVYPKSKRRLVTQRCQPAGQRCRAARAMRYRHE